MGPMRTTDRRPLHGATLRRAVVDPAGLWTELHVISETGSTNADVAAAARAGAAEGLVLLAESQTAGRGRLERTWESPPRAGIMMSVLLRPAVPPARLGWLPLLAGVALVDGVATAGGVEGGLKWPNDLLLRTGDTYAKAAGILAESTGEAVVLGIGLNVSQEAHELPDSQAATSLALSGATSLEREALATAVLTALRDWYHRWIAAGGDADACGLRPAYRDRCVTLGRAVTVALPGGETLLGTASDVDPDGRLLVMTGAGVRALAAGDVHHVR
jgi:BirA family transcriptional regulator, biotin operon repressor / biotin---[acetyl-CoA-carboxylase] ligase